MYFSTCSFKIFAYLIKMVKSWYYNVKMLEFLKVGITNVKKFETVIMVNFVGIKVIVRSEHYNGENLELNSFNLAEKLEL